PYAPGVIEAIGRNGEEIVARHSLKTAGPAAKIAISTDRDELRADGHDVIQMIAKLFDDAGIEVQTDNRRIHFELAGPARLLGVDNADLTDLEPYQQSSRLTKRGR